MSMQLFLVTDKPLQKTQYHYKYILPDIKEGDMFYNDKIVFTDNLTDEQKQTLGNIFRGFTVYAVDTCFHFDYAPEYKKQLSESYAKNSLDELKWLKQFAAKRLQNSDIFMVVNLWLGRENPFKRVKTERIEVDNWELSEEKSFEFSYGVVYQFVTEKNSVQVKKFTW